MKKICIAIHGLAHAGAERVVAMWADYLVKHGHDVSVVVYAPCEDTYELDDRVRIISIADSEADFFQMSTVQQLLSIRNIVRAEKPQIIMSFLPKMQIYMMLATLGIQIKRVETVRNNPWIDRDVGKKRFLWDLCFRRSDKIIVQTKEQMLYFPKKLQRKCVVISNPVSQQFFEQKKTYGNGKIRKFVAVARISAQKNYPMMVRAFAKMAQKIPTCTLDIYGAGAREEVQAMEELINQLGMQGKIRLRGWMRNIAEELMQYDAFLMSSDYEGMPNALAEAMATGLICLSTDCRTGPKDMIDSWENGILVRAGDEGAFAEGIESITEMDSKQCNDMGAAAREKIFEMCGEKNTLRRLLELINSEM